MEDSDRKQVVRAPGSVQARGLSLSPNLGKIGIRNGVCSSGFSWRSVSNRKGKPRSLARNQAESKDRERPFLYHPATPVVSLREGDASPLLSPHVPVLAPRVCGAWLRVRSKLETWLRDQNRKTLLLMGKS